MGYYEDIIKQKRERQNKDDVQWITTKTGRHIPIEPGETKKEAVEKAFGKSKEKSSKGEFEKGKDSYHGSYQFKGRGDDDFDTIDFSIREENGEWSWFDDAGNGEQGFSSPEKAKKAMEKYHKQYGEVKEVKVRQTSQKDTKKKPSSSSFSVEAGDKTYHIKTKQDAHQAIMELAKKRDEAESSVKREDYRSYEGYIKAKEEAMRPYSEAFKKVYVWSQENQNKKREHINYYEKIIQEKKNSRAYTIALSLLKDGVPFRECVRDMTDNYHFSKDEAVTALDKAVKDIDNLERLEKVRKFNR